jgi:hypothetical protein
MMDEVGTIIPDRFESSTVWDCITPIHESEGPQETLEFADSKKEGIRCEKVSSGAADDYWCQFFSHGTNVCHRRWRHRSRRKSELRILCGFLVCVRRPHLSHAATVLDKSAYKFRVGIPRPNSESFLAYTT